MLEFLFQIIIYPVRLVIEIVFMLFIWVFKNNYGIAIAGVSLSVSFLCLPLYLKAEKLQESEREIQRRLKPKVDSIKRNFKGDEQYMILSAYYRENRYHPLMALRTSLSLLLQIPFFLAAYSFLSHLELLKGASFFMLKDLGAPDALLSVGSFSVNVLPVLMTVINCVSGMVYTKGFPIKEKVQLYGMAGIFLVLLYHSPCGLVLYWTLNNVFSLCKNIVIKMKRPLRFVYVCMCLGLLALCVYVCVFRQFPVSRALKNKTLTVIGSVLLAGIPLYIRFVRFAGRKCAACLIRDAKLSFSVFLVAAALCWLVVGVLVPLNLIASDPKVFTESLGNISLRRIAFYPAVQSFGFLFFWGIYLFILAPKKIKALFAVLLTSAALFSMLNYYCFSGDYGNLSPDLHFQLKNLLLSRGRMFLNAACCLAVPCLVMLCARLNKMRVLNLFMAICIFSTGTASIYNVVKIRSAVSELARTDTRDASSVAESADVFGTKPFVFSEGGKNYLLVMLDREIGKYVEILFARRPDLAAKYTGFVFYPNAISSFQNTLFGVPALMGGYEYTSDEMNKRTDTLMKDKHNEAVFWIPEMFRRRGYTVTLTGIPYVDYERSPSVEFIRSMGFRSYSLDGVYSQAYIDEYYGGVAPPSGFDFFGSYKRNLLLLSVLLTGTPWARDFLYDDGNYRASENYESPERVEKLAFDRFTTLFYLPRITRIQESGNTYTVMVSDLPHDPSFFQYPEYVAVPEITDFGENFFKDTRSFRHFHSNAAALVQLAKWFDFLKERGVYDNTRIVIVSDHGAGKISCPGLSGFQTETILRNSCTLLVKDFDASEPFRSDSAFMTNVDVPSIMLEGVGDVENPYTGKPLQPARKNPFYVLANAATNPEQYRGTTCLTEKSFFWEVTEPVFEPESWKLVGVPED